MNAPASPYPSSNRFDPPITPARNAHGCALCVVLNPLDNLPLIPHNPYRDGCSHIVYPPVSLENPAGYTVSGIDNHRYAQQLLRDWETETEQLIDAELPRTR